LRAQSHRGKRLEIFCGKRCALKSAFRIKLPIVENGTDFGTRFALVLIIVMLELDPSIHVLLPP
jgi:hypothetical protein